MIAMKMISVPRCKDWHAKKVKQVSGADFVCRDSHRTFDYLNKPWSSEKIRRYIVLRILCGGWVGRDVLIVIFIQSCISVSGSLSFESFTSCLTKVLAGLSLNVFIVFVIPMQVLKIQYFNLRAKMIKDAGN